ncbi:MAG: hypothetical protein COA78_09090 [Blastopirellula sp.]|nr:MAG: hypothetical protein COA78_09090 [Blastopirellula sp.]
MGWEKRGQAGPYYYRSVRLPNGKVRKLYFGNGVVAYLEIKRIAEAKAALQAEKQAILKEQRRTAEAEQLVDELVELSSLLFEATMLSAGYWRGRDYGKWRKRRGFKE